MKQPGGKALRTNRYKNIVKTKLFFGSFTVTLCLVLILFFINRRPSATLQKVSDHVFVTSQLQTKQIRNLPNQSIWILIDLRPDGEARDQPSSTEMKNAAEQRGLKFFYIPVPHENIPDKAVTALQDALSDHERWALLYCRTGRRAVRTFALAEASRPDGPNAEAILKMVKTAGFSADDITNEITRRITHRNSLTEEKP
jgi:uncharacterized protein (TIGR01244 family)